MNNSSQIVSESEIKVAVSEPVANEYLVKSSGFVAESGVFVTRPEKPSADNVFYGSVSADLLAEGKMNFEPEYTPLIMQDDEWQELTNGSFFWLEATDSTKRSIAWYLLETAPAAIYGIRCTYETENYGNKEVVNEYFKILYTGDWTYIKLENDQGMRRIRNFVGGSDLTLTLNVTYNDGAAASDLPNKEQEWSTGASYGSLNDNYVVNTESMVDSIIVKTVSGKVYSAKNIVSRIDKNKANRVELRFTQALKKDIYIVQFTSNVNNQIIGQFVIDNSKMKSGVNLSQFWVVSMIFGGLLALGASMAYLLPFLIVKINEARVYKENERVARMKNPEAYAATKKKSFKEVINNIIYKIKTPAYKRTKKVEETPVPEEEKQSVNRFTEMLRERKEKRDFMRDYNVSSEEVERIQAKENALAADEVNSFAALRDDDDDEIATFHAAREEISTLETGAYVDGGARFAKLDSLLDDDNQDDFTYGGNSNNDENNE